VQYPVPDIMHLEGGLTAYGYENELLLIATITPPAAETITPPAELKDGSQVAISAVAGWCVCSDICVLGKQNLDLELPVASDRAKTAHGEIFDAWKGRMPEPSQEAFASMALFARDGGLSGSVRPGHGAVTSLQEKFVWKADPPAQVYTWIPGPCDDLIIEGNQITTDGRVTTASFQISRVQGISPASSTVNGILEYDVPGQPPRGVAVSLDRRSLGLPVP
jgi:hypothetical protein